MRENERESERIVVIVRQNDRKMILAHKVSRDTVSMSRTYESDRNKYLHIHRYKYGVGRAG